jgi:hypothetical protein
MYLVNRVSKKGVRTSKLTLCSTALLEKVIVTQLVKNSTFFFQSGGSLPTLQKPATSPYPEPDESSRLSHILFLEDPFQYYLLSTPKSPNQSLPFNKYLNVLSKTRFVSFIYITGCSYMLLCTWIFRCLISSQSICEENYTNTGKSKALSVLQNLPYWEFFSSPPRLQAGSGVHPASSNGYRGLFPWG